MKQIIEQVVGSIAHPWSYMRLRVHAYLGLPTLCMYMFGTEPSVALYNKEVCSAER